ncbi:exported hypothetical protein [uncultured Pleomorphomonas sp.]|uniref:Lipoprotein n=2 Tax=uncultured Pleomorphomonas sp. TaxID=442121 RepID=A0A212KYR3_9HYPH|nr:exported hypothetical protein [uncultured Pleomorphomonas sp.]
MRFPTSRSSRFLAAVAAVVATLSLGGCASGPSDFLSMASEPKAEKPIVRDANQQAALAAALAAQSHGYRMPSDDTSTVMALSAARQQQNEEAQALIQETEAAFKPAPAPVCDPYSVDPATACPAKAP